MNPELDLALARVIRAPLADVWQAWTDPRRLERWWLPAPMTAQITMAEHPEGTDYRVTVFHADPAARKRHEELGFMDGWGTVTDQLAALVEQGRGR